MANGRYYPSCGAGRIYVRSWFPQEKPRAIVQIIHGIGEHGGRYDAFASWLNDNGIAVVAEDHMGHGMSVEDGPKGYFHGGWFSGVEDTVRLAKDTMAEHPGIPYILFGHSMGSFMARTILAKYPQLPITGCIICGTGWQSPALLKVAIPLCKVICKVEGEENPSSLLQSLVFGGYNKQFKDAQTPSDWLSRDKASVKAYIDDPLCGFAASSGLMRDMLTGIAYIQKKKSLAQMPKALPVYFIAGDKDPVGDNGAGVLKAVDAFRKAGMEDVSVKLYPDCRHEIHNELNAHEVFEDVLNWISEKTPTQN